MKKYLIGLAAASMAVSACSGSDNSSEDDGFAISFNSDGESDGESADIEISGDGEDSKFSLKTDGFSMDIDLPKMSFDSDDFDLNNVSLYPGSKVTGLNVEDNDGNGGKVSLSFKAPTSFDTLVSWYEEKMSDQNFIFEKDGNILSGKTDDGDPFILELTEKSADETVGKLQFSEPK
ncbi:MAG: hypothetical protein ABJO01_08865 [Parasphingorhabdus sp.]|uniref:hypothetical protein n=1 Tax=Parasphingorhabdus sp. TaxID=2709688 RepID=UPI0032980B5C